MRRRRFYLLLDMENNDEAEMLKILRHITYPNDTFRNWFILGYTLSNHNIYNAVIVNNLGESFVFSISDIDEVKLKHDPIFVQAIKELKTKQNKREQLLILKSWAILGYRFLFNKMSLTSENLKSSEKIVPQDKSAIGNNKVEITMQVKELGNLEKAKMALGNLM